MDKSVEAALHIHRIAPRVVNKPLVPREFTATPFRITPFRSAQSLVYYVILGLVRGTSTCST